MATVSISPLTVTLTTNMSSRRQPLSTISNVANSPYRAVASTTTKQKRSYANIQREDAYGQPPPAKKQMLDAHQQALRTPPRQSVSQVSVEGRVFSRKSTIQPSNIERRCVTIRADRGSQQQVTKAQKIPEESLESIRQWQKFYRRNFPKFVFYFESISEDVRLKYTKQVLALGARDEKFFSNEVTHVVTTRSIPPEIPFTSSTTAQLDSQHGTINPSLLNRSSETADMRDPRSKFTFEAPVSRRLVTQGHDGDARRQQARSSDVLYKARELGIKIWALEKLQRMMTTMFDTDTGYQISHTHNKRSHSVQGGTITRAIQEADLSQLLRNERIYGPSDRDLSVATKEMTIFKGPYIYIHDIDERRKPIMVREYNKVTQKEDGDWPQFRSVPNGKCPFVDEQELSRRELEKEKELIRIQSQKEREMAVAVAVAPRTRAAVEAAKMQPPKAISKRALSQFDDGANRSATVSTRQANPFDTNRTRTHRAELESSSRGQNAFVSRAGVGRLFGGEPVASGVQPSSITSAIRSQMISSTAAQPGLKVGTSKELHGLQRKVLEKTNGGSGPHGSHGSHRLTDITSTVREDTTTRPAKREAQRKFGVIDEDDITTEREEMGRRDEAARKAKAVQQRKLEKRDAKPGYCENCNDKFEDFDEHVSSRKHRKFAEKAENWRELDALLGQLVRPLL
ncbi:fa0c8945-587f-457f-aa63-cbd5a4798d52 [Sclerotinia trifoliorum]|uniref:Fa0c8945-587f-457f-aa63-cbd5a4798d52 n=1 Tax=Sclerotinia trifoliorum TaxID=28548 RepID=A0A8H2W2M8_9HELO|nr:fa0c8945-587f-457f-aa63-cbd5a4798d52 [Sclerotinia trifoliorum]